MKAADLYDRHLALAAGWQRQVFVDEMENTFSVGLASAFAEAGGGEFSPRLDLTALPAILPWEVNWLKVARCDTASPILVLVQGSGRITIADGRHRVARARWIERRANLPAWILPWTYAAKSASRIEYEVFDHL